MGFLVSSRSRLSNGIGPGEVLGAWMDIFSQYYVTNSLGPMTNDKKRVDESSEIKKEPRVKREYSSLTRHRWCFPRALIFIVFFSFVRWWDAVKLTIFEKLRLLPCFPCAVTEQQHMLSTLLYLGFKTALSPNLSHCSLAVSPVSRSWNSTIIRRKKRPPLSPFLHIHPNSPRTFRQMNNQHKM